MDNDINTNIANAKIIAGGHFAVPSNAPAVSKGRQYQYYGYETANFVEQQARYASNYFLVQAQGLNPEDIYEYITTTARISNLVSPGVAETLQQNWKNIFFDAVAIDYIFLGAEIIVGEDQYADRYLLTNLDNQASLNAGATMRRENATWCHYDYYGNIIKTGFVWAKNQELATSPKITDFIADLRGYQHCVMQRNAQTEGLSENDRIILGNNAYFVRGLDNFTQEFTDDIATNRLFYFDLSRTEPTENDDMVNKIAEGKSFKWVLDVKGISQMANDSTKKQTLTVKSIRNGVEVFDSDEYPISYVFSSLDPSVATVDSDGVITPQGAGSCFITVMLEQNPNITGNFLLFVSDTAGDGIYWENPPQAALTQTQSCTAQATYFSGGVAIAAPVTFSFSGAEAGTYSADLVDINGVTITCYKPCDTPLTVTATCNGKSISADIALLGY